MVLILFFVMKMAKTVPDLRIPTREPPTSSTGCGPDLSQTQIRAMYEKMWFKRADIDNSGSVSSAELNSFLKTQGFRIGPKFVLDPLEKALLQFMGYPLDDQLTLEEFQLFGKMAFPYCFLEIDTCAADCSLNPFWMSVNWV